MGALAALSLPGVVLEGAQLDIAPWLSALLVVLPLVIWIATVLLANVESPMLTLVAVGGAYGLALGVAHSVFMPPAVAESLSPRAGHEELVLRLAVFVSSLFTGCTVGLVAGLLAVAVRWLLGRIHGRL